MGNYFKDNEDDEPSEDFPWGGMCEPYDMEGDR